MDEKQVSSNIYGFFSSLEHYEYCNALFNIKFIFIDKIFSEVLKTNDVDTDLFLNDDHIKIISGVGYA